MPNIKDLFEVYRPKPKDEQEFVDKHVVVKHKDENGNGDDVFNASNVKKVDRKKTRMGYDVPEDEKVYEETDIDESYQELMALKNNIARNEKKLKLMPGISQEKKALSIRLERDKKRHKEIFNKQFGKNEAVELDKDQIANSILEMAEVEGVELTEQELNNLVNTLIEAADEDTEEKSEMAQTQLHFIMYAVKEILEYIKMGGEIEEWYQNKLSKVHSDVESLHSYVEGEKRRTGMVKEDADEQIDEVLKASTPMKIWIKDFTKSDAPQFKGKSAEKRREMAIAAKLEAERGPQNEEVDQIDELSKKTLKSYAKDAAIDAEYVSGHNSLDPDAPRIVKNRAKYIDIANKKLAKEEVDQIDELSKKTVASYLKKSAQSSIKLGNQHAKLYDYEWDPKTYTGTKNYHSDESKEKALKINHKQATRASGRELAKNKLITPKVKIHATEEVEQIDELSKKTLKSYVDKTNTRVKDYPTPLSFRKAMLSPGIAKAKLGKSYKRRPLPDVKIKATNEEVELDEVFDTPKGKAVGREYIKRASTNAFGKGFTGGAMLNRQIDDPASREQEQRGGEKAVKTGLKRLVGIGRATDRLTKEEVERIDELSKEAIASYTVQAADDLPVQARKTGASKVKNRIKGINMAVDRLYTKEDIINNAINKFVPEEAKYTVDERFEMRLEDVPELHRPALAELFNGLTEANKKVMLNQLSEEAGLQKLINFVIENRND